jgi:late competence protein required for DNA uptake (superfamily II DNA/RNA helicase)
MTQLPSTSTGSDEVICPFCGSVDTELFSLFGHLLLSSHYYCRSCRTVFDVVRWEEPAGATPAEERKVDVTGARSSNRGATGKDAG